jgi:flagellar biosynthesis protein FlhA
VLAIGEFLGSLPGEPTREPVFGLDAKWIPSELRSQAELSGATVVDRTAVITTHLAEVVTTHAGRLLGREDVRLLTDVIKRTHPVVVEDLTPAQLSLGQVQRVLQSLLDEGVSVRDLVRIYEALSLRAQFTKEHDVLVEAARVALGPAIVAPHVHEGVVHVISFDPQLEQRMLESLRSTEEGPVLVLDPSLVHTIVGGLSQLVIDAENRNLRPVLACAPQIRMAVRRLARPAIDRLPVLSYPELSGTAQVRSVGVVTGERLAEVTA